jgi:hypothetical protein
MESRLFQFALPARRRWDTIAAIALWEPSSLTELAVDIDRLMTDLLGWRDSLAATTGS